MGSGEHSQSQMTSISPIPCQLESIWDQAQLIGTKDQYHFISFDKLINELNSMLPDTTSRHSRQAEKSERFKLFPLQFLNASHVKATELSRQSLGVKGGKVL